MLAKIPKSQKIAVMVGTMLAMLLSALDQTIVATAMPRIVQDLQGLEHLSWVITSYLLASTVIVPIYGKLSDIYGRKYFIMAAVAIFVVGSILSGLSQNMFQLIIFRGIQGLGAGAIFANAFAVIGDLFPPAERGRWQGLFGAVFGLASIIGPALGGWLTDNASWRWAFFINVPVGILALVVIGFFMPKIKPDHSVKRSIDYAGAAFLTVGLVCLLLGLVWGGNQFDWNSVQIIGLFISALVSFIAFVFIERVAQEPIIPLSLFKNSIFTVSMIIIFLTGFGMFGAILYIPLFAQLVLGASATNSGAILTPMMLGMVTAAIISGQVISRTGTYKTLAMFGLALASCAMLLLSTMDSTTSQTFLVLRMIAAGIGLGITFPIFTLAVQNAFDHSKLGVVTASTQLFRSIGATVGTAILGGVLNNRLNTQLGDLSADPFVKMIAQVNAAFTSNLDANKLQAILIGPGREQIDAVLQKLPPVIKPQALIAFQNFVEKTRVAFASAITDVFFIASFFMLAAFITSFFLREIKLRKSHDEKPEEIGKELADEEAIIPAADEPTIY